MYILLRLEVLFTEKIWSQFTKPFLIILPLCVISRCSLGFSVKLQCKTLVKNWKLILTTLFWRVFELTNKSNIHSGNGNYRDLWLILRLCKESLLSRGFKGWRSWQWNQSRGLKVATRSGPMCQFITVLATPDGWGNQSVTLYTKTLLICKNFLIKLNIICLFDLGFRQ